MLRTPRPPPPRRRQRRLSCCPPPVRSRVKPTISATGGQSLRPKSRDWPPRRQVSCLGSPGHPPRRMLERVLQSPNRLGRTTGRILPFQCILLAAALIPIARSGTGRHTVIILETAMTLANPVPAPRARVPPPPSGALEPKIPNGRHIPRRSCYQKRCKRQIMRFCWTMLKTSRGLWMPTQMLAICCNGSCRPVRRTKIVRSLKRW